MIGLDQLFIAGGVSFSQLFTVKYGDTLLIDDREYTVTEVTESNAVTAMSEDGPTEILGLVIDLSGPEKSDIDMMELNRDRELYLRDDDGELLDSPDRVAVPEPHHQEMYALRRKLHFTPDTVEEKETHSALDSLRGYGSARQYLGMSTKRNGTQTTDFFEVDVEDGIPLSSGLLGTVDSCGLEVVSVVDGAGEIGESTDSGYTVVLRFS